MIVKFDEVFRKNDDGSLTPPLRQIKVGGAKFGQGVTLNPGANFAGIDFHQYIDHYLDVEEEGGVLIIKRIIE